MFDSLIKLVGDVATVVTKPVEAAVDVTRVVTKPLADVAKGAADTIKEVTKGITDD